MTLDDLADVAFKAWKDGSGPYTIDDCKTAVIAVLDAVERECVPAPDDTEPEANDQYLAGVWDGWAQCRMEMLEKINALRGEK